MLSNFIGIIQPILSAKKISLTSFQNGRLRDIEKKMDRGEIDTTAAISVLRQEFKYNLTEDDYRKIEKELGYSLK